MASNKKRGKLTEMKSPKSNLVHFLILPSVQTWLLSISTCDQEWRYRKMENSLGLVYNHYKACQVGVGAVAQKVNALT